MSFKLQAWNCFSRLTTGPKPVFYTYDVNLLTGDDKNDTLSTIVTSGFFNSQANTVAANDLLYVIASDSAGLYRFTSANGVTPVTVGAFDAVPAGSITPSDMSTAANYKLLCLPVSFESGQQATHTVYFPMAVTVTKIRSFVTKAIANTDVATITAQNNAGSAMTNGAITIPISASVANENMASPTTNNTFTAGQKLQLVCAKTTAGGTANVYVEYYTTG